MSSSNFTDVLLARVSEDRGLCFIGSEQDKFVSYRELLVRARRCLGFLQRLPDQPREIVLQLESHESFVVAFTACVLGGYIAVPLATGGEADCQKKVMNVWPNLTRPLLVIDVKNQERLVKYCQQADLPEFLDQAGLRTRLEDEVLGGQWEGTVRAALPTDIAFVQYSSGSTGKPKGSMVSHANLVANTLDIIERGGIGEADQSISWLPLSHDFGLICVFLTNVMAGINQYMIPTNLFIRRPLLWLSKVTEYRISLMYSPNFGLQYILSSLTGKIPVLDLSSVRLIYNGSEPVIDALCASFVGALVPYGLQPHALCAVYGLAEATVGVSFPALGDSYEAVALDRRHLTVGSAVRLVNRGDAHAVMVVAVGRPLARCRVRVVSADDEVLPDLTIGHIQLEGENLIQGYYHEKELTIELYTGDGWLKTGDLGFLKGGKVFITGRHKNLIIINGQNYYPHDMEVLASEIPGLQFGDLIACGIPQADTLNDELVIFVISKGGRVSEDIERQIRKVIFQNFGLSPLQVVAIRKAPKTTSGKVQYFKLRELFVSGGLNAEAVAQE